MEIVLEMFSRLESVLDDEECLCIYDAWQGFLTFFLQWVKYEIHFVVTGTRVNVFF